MFFKPVVDIRGFVQREVRSLKRKGRCDSPSKILLSSPMNLTEQDIITLCQLTSCSDALKDTQFLDQRYQLLQTMKYKLHSEAASDQAPITKCMAEKIAGSGLSYNDLKQLLVEHGKKALITVFLKPPTASETTKPRVTRTPTILASILKHFERRDDKSVSFNFDSSCCSRTVIRPCVKCTHVESIFSHVYARPRRN